MGREYRGLTPRELRQASRWSSSFVARVKRVCGPSFFSGVSLAADLPLALKFPYDQTTRSEPACLCNHGIDTMADDTRQPESKPTEEVTEVEVRRPRRPKPKHDFPKTQAGKLWEAFGNPDEPINEMPGGMVNTAGGRPKEVTWRDAFQNPFKTRDGRIFYQVPCARDALLVGILAGAGVGGVRFILKGEHDLRDHSAAPLIGPM